MTIPAKPLTDELSSNIPGYSLDFIPALAEGGLAAPRWEQGCSQPLGRLFVPLFAWLVLQNISNGICGVQYGISQGQEMKNQPKSNEGFFFSSVSAAAWLGRRCWFPGD